MALDNHGDLQAWLANALPELKQSCKATFLDKLNKAMMKPCTAFPSILDQLDVEIRSHPSPCTCAQSALFEKHLESWPRIESTVQ